MRNTRIYQPRSDGPEHARLTTTGWRAYVTMVTAFTKPEDDRQVDVVNFFKEPSRWSTLLTSQRATDGQSRSDPLPRNLNRGDPSLRTESNLPFYHLISSLKARCAQKSADHRHHHLRFTIQTSFGRSNHWWNAVTLSGTVLGIPVVATRDNRTWRQGSEVYWNPLQERNFTRNLSDWHVAANLLAVLDR